MLTITAPICSGAHAHVLPEQPVQVHDGEPELGLVDEANRVPEAERLNERSVKSDQRRASISSGTATQQHPLQ
jgi:hypothetical protein